MTAMLCLPLLLGLVGQAPSTEPGGKDERAARLGFMKRSLEEYNLRPASGRGREFQIRGEPVFRLTNPVGNVVDGAIFVWDNREGRPAAAVQAFLIKEGFWLHEFTSLSTDLIVAERAGSGVWTPARAGLTFRPVPDAPRPSGTAEARLRQMRELAVGFTAEDHFRGETWHALRLLPRPLVRYGGEDKPTGNGAVFSFVLGTDPEVFLLIESRPGPGGPAWHYAFAPMTAYAVKGFWKGREVWSLPWRVHGKDPTEPFHTRRYQGEP